MIRILLRVLGGICVTAGTATTLLLVTGLMLFGVPATVADTVFAGGLAVLAGLLIWAGAALIHDPGPAPGVGG